MKLTRLHIFTLAAAIAVATCAPTDDNDELAEDSVGDTLAANVDSANQMPTEPVVSGLDDVDDSGISGEATATHSQDQVTVSILLKDGAKADVSYPAHIHTGTCDAGGPVAVELEPVKNLQSQKTIPLSSLPAGQPAFIQVHDASGKPVACGNMKGHDDDNRAMRDTTARTTTGY